MYRYKQEEGLTTDDLIVDINSEWIKEDDTAEKTRDITDPGFYARYDSEAELITHIMDQHGDVKSVLELGSGPGFLAQKIMERKEIKRYDLVDGEGAAKVHAKRGYKGNFIVKNMMDSYSLDGMQGFPYDFIIINDFLEHVRNPSHILNRMYYLSDEKTKLFISVPNWRMGHTFFYPGLFDYDNFIKFVEIHKFKTEDVYGSGKRINMYPNRLDSETQLPDALIHSWNWYFIFHKA
jgi:2-polyprenyl-3-methyl-5-hydroxy-6-metoxy-1,4-benzoquinol methylase